MDQRARLRGVQIRAERRIQAAHRDMARALRAAAERNADQTPDGLRLTPAGATRLMGQVDAILDTLYPRRRGEPSVLEDLIAEQANAARALPVGDEVDRLRRALRREPALLRRMEDADQS